MLTICSETLCIIADWLTLIINLIEGMSDYDRKSMQGGDENIEKMKMEEGSAVRNLGEWSEWEQEKYIVFLEVFGKQLQNGKARKLCRIFSHMAKFLEYRDGIQCRSHHVKQLRTHRKLKSIIQWHRKFNPVTPEILALRNSLAENNNIQPHFLNQSKSGVDKNQQAPSKAEPEIYIKTEPQIEAQNKSFSPTLTQHEGIPQTFSQIVFFPWTQFCWGYL